jgi:predicted tellurium resistance membrane protein TerC
VDNLFVFVILIGRSAVPRELHSRVLLLGLPSPLCCAGSLSRSVPRFIGVKLITEALLESGVHRIGPVPVSHIGTGLSLAVIAAVITTVTVTSLLAARRHIRPEPLNLPAGSRRLRTQRRLRRG